MKKLSKITLFVIIAAIIVSVCTLFAGCGTSSVDFQDFSTAVDEFQEKMITAKKSKLEVSYDLDVLAVQYYGSAPLEVHYSVSDSIKKLNGDRLDLTNKVNMQSSNNITDNISLDFGEFDVRAGAENELVFEEVNQIYVRDDTLYAVEDGELTSMVSGELYDGDLSKSAIKEYVTASTAVGNLFDKLCLDYFRYPEEKKYVNVIGSVDSTLTSVSYDASKSGDKLEADIVIKTYYLPKKDPPSRMSEEEEKEYFGHFENRPFYADMNIKLTMDTSPSLKKSKFEKLDYDGLTKDILYMDYDSGLAGKIAAGDKTEIAVKGGGGHSYTDLVYKNGEYTPQIVNSDSVKISCAGYMCDTEKSSAYVTSRGFENEDYEYSDNKLTVNREALSNAKTNMENEGNSGGNMYTANIRYVTISFTYKTLTKNSELNEAGYYDSDQYRTFSHTIYLYM